MYETTLNSNCTPSERISFWTEESVPVGGAMTPGWVLNHLPECSIKSSTLSVQTAWTGFNPYLYSGGSSWQQPWWSGMHCIPSWHRGRGRHCVGHNAPVKYKRPCSCYFPLERDLLRMTHHYEIRVKPVQAVCTERGELLIEYSGRWFENSPRQKLLNLKIKHDGDQSKGHYQNYVTPLYCMGK